MITVAILINGNPFMARSARKMERKDGDYRTGIQRYRVDTGEIIKHRYEDGAVELAHKLLDTIRKE
jgi:hypothetical protein